MLIKILNAAIPLTFILFHVLEAIVPARVMPKHRLWRLKGFAWFVVIGAVSANVPALLAPHVKSWNVVDLSPLGVLGALVMIPVIELTAYGLHRLRHSPLLWRFHQLHHAAERHDISGAFMFHPLDPVPLFASITVVTALLGVTPEAAAVAGFYGFFMTCFTHANINTPRWLGYIISRPEAHSVHHARGVHAFNYASLPLIDMLFGTFRNPQTFTAEHGFFDGSAQNVARMLLLQDGTRRPLADAVQPAE